MRIKIGYLHGTDLWETETDIWKKMQLNLEPELVVEGTAQCVRVIESESQNAFSRCHHNDGCALSRLHRQVFPKQVNKLTMH